MQWTVERILRTGARMVPRGLGLRQFCPRPLTNFFVTHIQRLDSPIEVLGQKMFLDPLDSLGLALWGKYEERETNLVRKLVRRGDVVLDIGAHIGYYTLLFASLVGEEGQVYAFEPEPSNHALLLRNISLNGHRNVQPEMRAVSDRTGRAMFHLTERTGVGHSLCEFDIRGKSIEVDMVRLDDYFEGRQARINFIKMDIEGAEGLATKGMESLLTKNAGVKILAEFFPGRMNRTGVGAEEYVEILHGHEYLFYDLKQERAEPSTLDALLRQYRGGKATNLLCTRQPLEGDWC
jgi:FkbM family methyltransferase